MFNGAAMDFETHWTLKNDIANLAFWDQKFLHVLMGFRKLMYSSFLFEIQFTQRAIISPIS